MSDPNTPENTHFPDDIRNSFKQNLSKFEHDLYHDEDDIVAKVIRIKRVGASNKNEKWKIFEDTKIVFVLEGSKLSKKECEFLRTIEGINFLIAQAKIGIKSFNRLRTELKKKMASKSK